MIDYTKVVAAQSTSYDEGLRNYMLKVYTFMALGLLLTGVMAFATLYFEPIRNLMYVTAPGGQIVGQSGFGIIIMFAPIGIALLMFMGLSKLSLEITRVLFWVYAGLMGMSLSSLGLVYPGQYLAKTFFICASVFGSMSIYGYTTKRELNSFGSFLVMGVIGLIISSLVNAYLQSSSIDHAISFIGIGLFMGITAWDTQKLKSMYYKYGGGEEGEKMAVVGAFSLYLDFINLYIHMLRFFSDREYQD
jgi:hypothetical protein